MDITLSDDHQYTLNGRHVPGVTEILDGTGFTSYDRIPEWMREFAMGRGRALHDACLYDYRGTLNEKTLDTRLIPYLEGWRLFRRETGVVFEAMEEMVGNEAWGYCGTLDGRGMLNGRRVVIDIKTTSVPLSAGLQLAAYDACLEHHHDRMGIALRNDGTYRMKTFDSPEDIYTFYAAVRVYTQRERYKT